MSELEQKGTKRKLDDYFKEKDDESIQDNESIQTEISNAWHAINESQDAEEVDDDAKTVTSEEEPATKEVEEEEEDYENEDDDNLIQPLKKRKTETDHTGPSKPATGQIKDSQQAVYKKLNEQKLSKFMENTIGECKDVTESKDVTETIFATKTESTCLESLDSKSIYSHHFDDDKTVGDGSDDEKTVGDSSDEEDHDNIVGHDASTKVTGHESIKSIPEYIELRTKGKIQRKVTQVNGGNINGLNEKFQNIINKYKKDDRGTTDIELPELEKDYSYVFGNMGVLFYKYKKDKSNLHNAFFPTLLGKKVKLDDDTFERIYKKQMVLDLCLFVYNLNLFEKIHRPYTYITYNLGAFDNKTNDAEDSTLFSVASSTSNRDNIKEIRKQQNKEGIDLKQLNKSEFVEKEVEEDLTPFNSQQEKYDSDGGKKSKSNQGGKKGQNKGPNKGPKKNHKTNKKRSNRSFMMKSKKSKPRKTQRKKNSKKKTQRKKLIVKKDLKKKTKRVRFAV